MDILNFIKRFPQWTRVSYSPKKGPSKARFATNKSPRSLMFHQTYLKTNLSLTMVVHFTSPTSKLKNTQNTSLHIHLSRFGCPDPTKINRTAQTLHTYDYPPGNPTYPAWQGTSSTQKCRLVGGYVSSQEGNTVGFFDPFISFIHIWVDHDISMSPTTTVFWLTTRQQFCFPQLHSASHRINFVLSPDLTEVGWSYTIPLTMAKFPPLLRNNILMAKSCTSW